MASSSLMLAVGGRLVQYGPAPKYIFQSAGSIANNTVGFLGVAASNHFAVVTSFSVRSSGAGELRLEDSAAVVIKGITILANTWTDIPLGGLGVVIAILGGDIGIRNLTGAASTIEMTGTWLSV